MGKTKKNRNAKQGIDTMGVSTSEIAKEISKPQTAMPICESNDDDDTDWQTMLWEVTKNARKLYDGISTLCLSYTEKQDAIAEVAEITYH